MTSARQEFIRQLEEMTNADVYILFTASGEQEYDVSYDFLPLFTESIHTRKDGRRNRAILIMETNGGDPTTAMAIVKQLHEAYSEIEGYAFNRCFSAGTLGMFGTDKIYMSKYAMFTPIDMQCFITEEDAYKPVIANYNAFIERTPNVREREFAEMYPAEYLTAIRTIRYSLQTLYPNFAKHCKEEYIEATWTYFNGGAGAHSTKINRSLARELGLMINSMPDDVEEILYNIINSYIVSTNMLIDSWKEMEVKDAYFETLGLTYVHYSKFQEGSGESVAGMMQIAVAKAEDCDIPEKKKLFDSKRCIEYGWKKE